MATPLPSLFWTALDTPLGTMILAARGRDERAALAGAWVVGQEETQRLSRQHGLVDCRDLMR